MAIAREYSGSDVRITLDGELLSEFADGEFLSIELSDDDTVSKVGANGSSAIAYKNNTVADMTLTLLGTSPDNAVVHDKVQAILTARHGHIDVVVADGRGDTVVSGVAVPKKRAPVKFATEVTDREWAFSLHIQEYTVGGNDPA